MADMRTKEEAPETHDNPYGYGLCIRINEDQYEKLGLSAVPKAGAKLSLRAQAFVASTTQTVERDGDDEGPDVFLELQITDLEVEQASESSDHAAILYGDES